MAENAQARQEPGQPQEPGVKSVDGELSDEQLDPVAGGARLRGGDEEFTNEQD